MHILVSIHWLLAVVLSDRLTKFELLLEIPFEFCRLEIYDLPSTIIDNLIADLKWYELKVAGKESQQVKREAQTSVQV